MNLVCGLAVLACSGAALGQWSDNFNRPDGPIGGDWTVTSGTWAIAANQGRHTSTAANEILTHNLASMAHGLSLTTLDVFQTGTTSQFSAVLIGLGGTDAIMVKVQDQVAGTAGFSHIGIYHRTTATAWGNWTVGTTTLPNGTISTTTGFVAIPAGTEFASARMSVWFPDADTVRIDFDTDMNGSVDQTYTRTGVSAFAANMGAGFGIAAWGNTATFDNWGVSAIPGPGTVALLGLAGLAATRRRRA